MDLPTTVDIGAGATAQSSTGSTVEVNENADLDVGGGAGEEITIPVILADQATLTSFTDAESGVTLTVENNESILRIPVKGDDGQVALVLKATLESAPEGTGQTATATVEKLEIEVPEKTVDLSGTDPNVGEVTFSVNAGITDLQDGASLTTTVSKTPDPAASSSISLVAQQADLEIKDIAYSINFTKTNLPTTSAEIEMSVGRAWVIEQLGGDPTAGNIADVIRVARTDDAGNTTFLNVSIADLNSDPIVFTVTAPGLSSYTLMAVQPAVAADEGTDNTTLIIIVAIIAVVLLGAGLFFLMRRRPATV